MRSCRAYVRSARYDGNLVGPAFTLRNIPAREDVDNVGRVRQSRAPAAQGDRDHAGRPRAGDRLPRRHARRVRGPDPGDTADEARGRRTGRRRRHPRCGTDRRDGAISGVLRRPERAAQPRAASRGGEQRADRLRRRRGVSRRHHRRRSRRRGCHSARHGGRGGARCRRTGGTRGVPAASVWPLALLCPAPIRRTRRRGLPTRPGAKAATRATERRRTLTGGNDKKADSVRNIRDRCGVLWSQPVEELQRMDFVNAAGLQVAGRCTISSTPRRSPAPASQPMRSGRALARWSAIWRRAIKALLDKRDALQRQIDAWHLGNRGRPIDLDAYLEFLRGIGYLLPEPADFSIGTGNVDPEIATIAGPQLVVPVTNARYALNAANARWGSLYDALYGTDAIPEDGGATRGPGYNKIRGARVVAKAREVLDQAGAARARQPPDAIRLSARGPAGLRSTADRTIVPTGLARSGAVRRLSRAMPANRQHVLLKHNGLHIEIVIDRDHPIGTGRCGRRCRRACWKRRSPRSRTARIRSPRSMPMTRSRPTATGSA